MLHLILRAPEELNTKTINFYNNARKRICMNNQANTYLSFHRNGRLFEAWSKNCSRFCESIFSCSQRSPWHRKQLCKHFPLPYLRDLPTKGTPLTLDDSFHLPVFSSLSDCTRSRGLPCHCTEIKSWTGSCCPCNTRQTRAKMKIRTDKDTSTYTNTNT